MFILIHLQRKALHGLAIVKEPSTRAAMKYSLAVPQKKKKKKKNPHRITVWSSNSAQGINPKQLKARTQKDNCTPMFTAASFIVVKKVETTQDMPFTDEWINKLWYIHTMEYDPTLQRNEVLTHVMNLENVMPSEISQIKKDKFCTIFMRHLE